MILKQTHTPTTFDIDCYLMARPIFTPANFHPLFRTVTLFIARHYGDEKQLSLCIAIVRLSDRIMSGIQTWTQNGRTLKYYSGEYVVLQRIRPGREISNYLLMCSKREYTAMFHVKVSLQLSKGLSYYNLIHLINHEPSGVWALSCWLILTHTDNVVIVLLFCIS